MPRIEYYKESSIPSKSNARSGHNRNVQTIRLQILCNVDIGGIIRLMKNKVITPYSNSSKLSAFKSLLPTLQFEIINGDKNYATLDKHLGG